MTRSRHAVLHGDAIRRERAGHVVHEPCLIGEIEVCLGARVEPVLLVGRHARSLEVVRDVLPILRIDGDAVRDGVLRVVRTRLIDPACVSDQRKREPLLKAVETVGEEIGMRDVRMNAEVPLIGLRIPVAGRTFAIPPAIELHVSDWQSIARELGMECERDESAFQTAVHRTRKHFAEVQIHRRPVVGIQEIQQSA